MSTIHFWSQIDEIGCALSHRDVAKRIANDTDARVLILDDDACVIEENLPHFSGSVRSVPAEWNLACLPSSPPPSP